MAHTFEQAMRMLRTHDPQIQEDGFALLQPRAAGFLGELIEAYDSEEDHGLKCWLLELIGLAQSDDALAVLTRELANDDESLRSWAARGLRALNSKAARTVLWTHSQSS